MLFKPEIKHIAIPVIKPAKILENIDDTKLLSILKANIKEIIDINNKINAVIKCGN